MKTCGTENLNSSSLRGGAESVVRLTRVACAPRSQLPTAHHQFDERHTVWGVRVVVRNDTGKTLRSAFNNPEALTSEGKWVKLEALVDVEIIEPNDSAEGWLVCFLDRRETVTQLRYVDAQSMIHSEALDPAGDRPPETEPIPAAGESVFAHATA